MSKLPIRQHLLTIACLKSAAKTVLVEVCELAENGGKGACFASNQTLADALGMSKATVVRKVEELEVAGLLTSQVVKAEGNRRYLRPTAAVRACYAVGTEVEQLLAASNLTIVKKGADLELDYSQNGIDYSQNEELTIVKTDTDYSQNASRVYGDYQDYQVDYQVLAREWESERVTLQKKIQALETENALLKADLLQLVPPVAEPPQPAAPIRPPAEVGPTFEEFWDAYGKKLDTKKSRLRWQALTLTQRTAAMTALPAYVAATAEDLQFRKHPLTWLNGECWNDDPPPPRTRAGQQPDASPGGRTAASPTKARQKTDW